MIALPTMQMLKVVVVQFVAWTLTLQAGQLEAGRQPVVEETQRATYLTSTLPLRWPRWLIELQRSSTRRAEPQILLHMGAKATFGGEKNDKQL